MKYLIKGIQNFDSVHRYIIKKDEGIHSAFCGLLIDLGIDKEDVLKQVDIIFDNLDNEFICINKKNLDVYLFVTKEYVNLIMKSDLEQVRLNEVIGRYFIFPESKE